MTNYRIKGFDGLRTFCIARLAPDSALTRPFGRAVSASDVADVNNFVAGFGGVDEPPCAVEAGVLFFSVQTGDVSSGRTCLGLMKLPSPEWRAEAASQSTQPFGVSEGSRLIVQSAGNTGVTLVPPVTGANTPAVSPFHGSVSQRSRVGP